MTQMSEEAKPNGKGKKLVVPRFP